MDARLGFDWRAVITFIDARSWLAKLFGFCYATFFPQLYLLPIWFCFARKPTRACAMS